MASVMLAFPYSIVTAGFLGRFQLPKLLFVLSYVIHITNAELSSNQLGAPFVASKRIQPTTISVPVIPMPDSVPLFHKTRRNYFSHHSVPVGFAPASSHFYHPLMISGKPPSRSQLPKPSMKKTVLAPLSPGTIPTGLAEPPLSPSGFDCCKLNMVQKRASEGCHCVYPIKLDLLLINVSQKPNWNVFLEELASQLGLRGSQIELINFYVVNLSRLNISMDITPHTGISFLDDDATAINSALTMHKVKFDPTLVGDYKLLNLTWFSSPTPSRAPVVSTLPVEGPPQNASSSTTKPVDSRKTNHSDLLLLIGIGVGVLVIAVISLLIIFLCTSRHEKTKLSKDMKAKPRTINATTAVGSGSFPHISSTRFLAYEELKEATNNFASASILGEGGFGKVFKGVLTDGTPVAIKRLNNGGHQGGKEFMCEVEMLSRLHHRNLVKLVGYYTSRDSVQNLLCYELVPNGSLEAWLHGLSGVNCPLNWDTRMKIALDAARGLAYLHEDSQSCVIHRDFKASNILLENDFHAKIADLIWLN